MRPAAGQARSLTTGEQRARATRPDLWPAFVPAEFPEHDDGDGQDLDED